MTSNLDDVERLFAQIERERGKLDIVFANAGFAKFARLGTIYRRHYNSILDINVKGLLFMLQKALPLMPDGTSVILNASVAASIGLGAIVPLLLPEWNRHELTSKCLNALLWVAIRLILIVGSYGTDEHFGIASKTDHLPL